jgi:hypothetical protein
MIFKREGKVDFKGANSMRDLRDEISRASTLFLEIISLDRSLEIDLRCPLSNLGRRRLRRGPEKSSTRRLSSSTMRSARFDIISTKLFEALNKISDSNEFLGSERATRARGR